MSLIFKIQSQAYCLCLYLILPGLLSQGEGDPSPHSISSLPIFCLCCSKVSCPESNLPHKPSSTQLPFF